MENVASSTLSRLNGRSIEPIPDYLLDKAEDDKVYIFNIYNREWRIDCVPGLGAVVIQACPEGRPYSAPLIVPGVVFEHYDGGDGKLLYRSSPARTHTAKSGRTEPGVVDDVLKPYAPRGPFSPNLIQWGVFAAAGSTPTAKELEQARQELLKTAKTFVADGDRKALQGDRGRSEINSVNREMCLLLNQKKNWLEEETRERDACPACGGNITKGVARCLHCHAILDAKKWAAFSGETVEAPGKKEKEKVAA